MLNLRDPQAAEPAPDLVDLTVVVKAQQAVNSALMRLVMNPWDDTALERFLRVRGGLQGAVAGAQLRQVDRR